MPITINQLIQERKKVIREIKAAQKDLDTKLEVFERHLQRILELRRKIPETGDYLQLIQEAEELSGFLNAIYETMSRGETIFGVV